MVSVSTSVTVKPDPLNGLVVMESGPIYFTPMGGLGKEDQGGESGREGALKQVLPEWLIWGGQRGDSKDGDDGNDVEGIKEVETITDSGVNDLKVDKEDDESITNTSPFSSFPTSQPSQSSTPFSSSPFSSPSLKSKSSIQAGFRIVLSWKPPHLQTNPSSTSSLLTNSLFFPWRSRGRKDQEVETSESVFDKKRSQDGVESGTLKTDNTKNDDDSNDSSINVSSKVHVWVDMNLPLRRDLSRAISFPPVKLLLSQAGGLMTKAVLRTLTPTLADLLILDHDRRRTKPHVEIGNMDTEFKTEIESESS